MLILAGENPDDIRARWLALAEQMGFDAETIPVYFIDGPFKISDAKKRIADEVEELGGVSLVIADSSAVYFEGDDENDNVMQGNHARMFRSLTKLAGGPCVLVICHPVKNAANDIDTYVPRGGGAFLNEMDGNLICMSGDDEKTAILWWRVKLRGPGFEQVPFEIRTVYAEQVRTAKGKQIPSVIAVPITEREQSERNKKATKEQDDLLIAMLEKPKASLAELANELGWFFKSGDPDKTKVERIIKKHFKTRKLVELGRTWVLTRKGKAAAEEARTNRDLAGATYD